MWLLVVVVVEFCADGRVLKSQNGVCVRLRIICGCSGLGTRREMGITMIECIQVG